MVTVQAMYHRILRISLLVVASVLVFDAGLFTPLTKEFSDATILYITASVGAGMSVSIPPNELNTITAELTAKERALDEREAELKEREIATRNFGDSESVDYSTYILSTILFILTVLIVLNYALDWARARDRKYEQQQTA